MKTCYIFILINRYIQGDSGRPMTCKASDGTIKLVGLTSFGPDECDGIDPGVYTKLSFFLTGLRIR